MKHHLLLSLLLIVHFFSCESPHEKSTRTHINNSLNKLNALAVDYDEFRDNETKERLAKINQYFNDRQKQLENYLDLLDDIYPSSKFKPAYDLSDSLLRYTVKYFDNRKELVMIIEELNTTVDLYKQSKKEFQEHKDALRRSSSWAGHHQTMIAFEEKKMKERSEKTMVLIDKLKELSINQSTMEDAFIAAEKELIQENEALGIFESLDIASKLFEKDNATAELINLYTTENLSSLLNNEVLNANLVSN